jgi:hypothetical protein
MLITALFSVYDTSLLLLLLLLECYTGIKSRMNAPLL